MLFVKHDALVQTAPASAANGTAAVMGTIVGCKGGELGT